MSDSKTIGGTITGGIQDISALLPLLGTEQCERHVGSALDRGFLYSAATPISIFGSLGIVRASFNILVASLSIQGYQFLGAKVLSDIGFSPSGTVAPMIALDPGHPKRFLAESRLETLLAEEHICNIPALTVSGGVGIALWNLKLVMVTLVISVAGLAPYASIIHDSGDANSKLLFPLGLGFPILRVFGSATCVIIAQFLIQIRIVTLLKSRLLFISINQLVQAHKIDGLASDISTGLRMENPNHAWTPELAAEQCIWNLQKWLDLGTDAGENHRKMASIYAVQRDQYLGPINTPIGPWVTLVLCFGLAIGCISTVIGYIGSFFLIQHSTSSNGPLVWLALEAVLSLLRILLWAINPLCDDSEGIAFELQLSTNPPILTCNRKVEDILHGNANIVLTRSNVNLEEFVDYAGPLPRFCVQGVELYYIFAINNQNSRQLLVMISAHKEQRSRILVKEAVDSPFSIYRGSILRAAETPFISFSVSGKAHPDSHFLPSDSVFMTELNAHYNKITLELQNQETVDGRKVFFRTTWVMERTLIETTNDNQRAQIRPPLLTEGENAYLGHSIVEWRRSFAFQTMDGWIDYMMDIFNTNFARHASLSADWAADEEGLSLVQKHEAIEKRCLLIACQQYLELSLICMTTTWDQNVRTSHANLINTMLAPFAESATELVQHRQDIRKHKLERRLTDELQNFIVTEARIQQATKQRRIDTYLVTQDTQPWSHTPMEDPVIRQKVSYLKSLVSDNSDPVGIFGLQPNRAAEFNAASASEQSHILVQIQKDIFVREMRYRFNNLPAQRNHRDHCEMRANKFFNMLETSAIKLRDFVDAPNNSNAPFQWENYSESLREVTEDWRIMLAT